VDLLNSGLVSKTTVCLADNECLSCLVWVSATRSK